MPLEEDFYILPFLRGGHTRPHRATGGPVSARRQERGGDSSGQSLIGVLVGKTRQGRGTVWDWLVW